MAFNAQEMNLRIKKLKEYAGQVLGRGIHSIRLTPTGVSTVKAIKDKGLTRVKIRQILKDKDNIRVIPKKKRSYKIRVGLKSKMPREERNLVDRLRSTHLVDLLKRKTITQKQVWIRHVREARSLLRTYRGKIPTADYRVVYRRIKGGHYRYKKKPLEELRKSLEILR